MSILRVVHVNALRCCRSIHSWLPALATAVLCAGSSLATGADMLLSLTNEWRYTIFPYCNAAWRSNNLDTSDWSNGPAPFHTEGLVIPGPAGTALPAHPTRTTYFRTYFTVTSDFSGLELIASNLLMAGGVIYLNGAAAAYVRMDQPVQCTSVPWSERLIYEVFALPTTNVTLGENLLAVEVHRWHEPIALGLSLHRGHLPVAVWRQPVDVNTYVGRTVQFTTAATGWEPRYQWLKEGAPLPNATNSILILSNVVMADAGLYFCLVSNSVNVVQTSNAVLTVSWEHVGIQEHPNDWPALEGWRTLFSITPTGSPPIFYQWFKDGMPLASGTNQTLVISNTTRADIGVYHVRLSNEVSAAVSSNAMLVFFGASNNLPGQLDASFYAAEAPWGSLQRGLTLQPDGKILVCGFFADYIVRLLPDGRVDPTFQSSIEYYQPPPSGSAYACAVQPDGKIVVGGRFTRVGGLQRVNLVRLHPDGSVDPTFDTTDGANGLVRAVAIQPDGKVLVAGEFTHLNDHWINYLARLNPDASIDPSFNIGSGANAPIRAMVRQPDGRILLGGYFTIINSQPRGNLARLHPDGSVDRNWYRSTFLLGPVYCITLLEDGRFYVGGDFVQYETNKLLRIARLWPNGSLDSSFRPSNGVSGSTPSASAPVYTIAAQKNGRILIGGFFTQVNGVPFAGFAPLDATGAIDTEFMNSYGGAPFGTQDVLAIASQDDGMFYLAGGFRSYSGFVFYWGSFYTPTVLRIFGYPVAPRIKLETFTHDQLGFSWSVRHADYVLEQSDQVAGPWQPATNRVTTHFNRLNVQAALTGRQGFFRLRQPPPR